MNEFLKFSWGHIISFLALLALLYIVFMGETYLSGGNFLLAGAVALCVGLLCALTFIGAQQLKATGRKFRRRIIWERILLLLTVPVFLISLYFANHFFNVRDQEERVNSEFRQALESADRMFDEYDAYSANRNVALAERLQKTPSLLATDPHASTIPGIRPTTEDQQRNITDLLELQLNSENYTNLKTDARRWIASANEGASTWNIFLMGNMDQISKAVSGWSDQLNEMSQPRIDFEGDGAETEPFVSAEKETALRGLDKVGRIFSTDTKEVNLSLLWFGLLAYLCLLFPWLIQSRHSKSSETLLGRGSKSPAPVFRSDCQTVGGNHTASSQNNRKGKAPAPAGGAFRL